jgi:hypothetical protein
LIEGGNHAQFGYYGKQSGDGFASITKEEQQSIVIREPHYSKEIIFVKANLFY